MTDGEPQRGFEKVPGSVRELSEGIADLHCRGGRYIVKELQAEYRDR